MASDPSPPIGQLADGPAHAVHFDPEYAAHILEREQPWLIPGVEPSLHLDELEPAERAASLEVSQVALNRVLEHCGHQPDFGRHGRPLVSAGQSDWRPCAIFQSGP